MALCINSTVWAAFSVCNNPTNNATESLGRLGAVHIDSRTAVTRTTGVRAESTEDIRGDGGGVGSDGGSLGGDRVVLSCNKTYEE